MSVLNKTRPSPGPWGTPLATGLHVDSTLLITTLRALDDRKRCWQAGVLLMWGAVGAASVFSLIPRLFSQIRGLRAAVATKPGCSTSDFKMVSRWCGDLPPVNLYSWITFTDVLGVNGFRISFRISPVFLLLANLRPTTLLHFSSLTVAPCCVRTVGVGQCWWLPGSTELCLVPLVFSCFPYRGQV